MLDLNDAVEKEGKGFVEGSEKGERGEEEGVKREGRGKVERRKRSLEVPEGEVKDRDFTNREQLIRDAEPRVEKAETKKEEASLHVVRGDCAVHDCGHMGVNITAINPQRSDHQHHHQAHYQHGYHSSSSNLAG